MTRTSPDQQTLLLDANFNDVEQFCDAVQAWDFDFHPLSARPQPIDFLRVQQFVAGGIDHGYARFSTALNQAGAPPPGKLTFTVLGANLGQLWWRGQHVDAGCVLIFPRNSELHSVSGSDFETNVLSVDDALLATICERHELALPTTSKLGEVFRPSMRVLRGLRAQLRQIRKADAPLPVADYLPIVEKLVIEWSLSGDPARTANSRGLRNRDRAVRRCLDAMAEQDLATLNAARLCDLAGVGARTLEYAFLERFDLGPAAFLRCRRMMAVHTELVQATPEDTGVGALAARYGFAHSGQFAKDYKSRFAEAPSHTLARSGPNSDKNLRNLTS